MIGQQRHFDTQQAITNASGVCSFTFVPPPLGSVLTGTIVVYDSPPGINWTIQVAGIPMATAVGVSPVNSIQQWQNETLVVTASGLTPGQIYHCTVNGVLEDGASAEVVQPVSPAINPSIFSVLSKASLKTLNNTTFQTGAIAVSNAGAIGLQITNGSPSQASTITCTIQWLASDAVTVLTSETWMMYGDPVNNITLLDVFPPLGSYINFKILCNGISDITYVLWAAGIGASFERPAPTLLLSTNSLTIGAGSAQNFILGTTNPPPLNTTNNISYWPGDVTLWMNTSIGIVMLIQFWTGLGWIDVFQLNLPNPAPTANVNGVCTLGRSSVRVDVNNTTGGALNVFLGLVTQR